MELATINTTEGAGYGAALLAGVGAGVWPDVPSACAAAVTVTGEDKPDTSQMDVYQTMYTHYRALYPALKPTFDGLAG